MPLQFADEDNVLIDGFTYACDSGNCATGSGTRTSTFAVNAPVICANIGNTTSNPNNKLDVIVDGVLPGGNFKFGGLQGGQQVALSGVNALNYSGRFAVSGDPALVCYSLTSDGVRKASSGLFTDTFDQPLIDSDIRLSVVQLPNSDNGYNYRYFVDVTIPVVSTQIAVPFTIRDGHDSSVFDTANSYYCEVALDQSSCTGQSTQYDNINRILSILPNTGYQKRFIVTRRLHAGVTVLPNSGSPLVLAGLFSYMGIDDKLSNNVAGGFATLSDLQPEVLAAGMDLSGLTEGGVLINRMFTIRDDTGETERRQLRAEVDVDFNGTIVPATVSCGASTPIPSNPVRNCTFDVVPPTPNFATDTTPGTYAPGVTASVRIRAVDTRNQYSPLVVIPLHVASSDNDAPVFDISKAFVADAGNGGMLTLTCSIAAPTSTACLGIIDDAVSGIKPGPLTAPDELSAQQAGVHYLSSPVAFALPCTLDSGTPSNFFALNSSPHWEFTPGHVDLDYRVSGIAGGATCQVTVFDVGTFAPGQTNSVVTVPVRIVVTP